MKQMKQIKSFKSYLGETPVHYPTSSNERYYGSYKLSPNDKNVIDAYINNMGIRKFLDELYSMNSKLHGEVVDFIMYSNIKDPRTQ